MIVKNHYSHKWTSCRYALGIFYETDNEHTFFDEKDEKLAGVAIYGYPVGRSAPKSISPELKEEEVLELTRLFIFDDYGIWGVDGIKTFVNSIEKKYQKRYQFVYNYMGQCIMIKR